MRKAYAPSLNKSGSPTRAEVEAAAPNCASAFAVLDAHLGTTKGYLCGDHFCFGDVTCAIQANRLVGNNGFGIAALAPSNFPNVVAWHSRLCKRPAFAAQVLPRFA